MDTVTYPDPKTAEFVNRFMIPFKANTQSSRQLAARYQIRGVPTIIVVDGDGREQYRTVGFKPPEEFIPSLMLGIAKTYFSQNLIQNALAVVDKLVVEYPRSGVVAEGKSLQQACLSRRIRG